ncbi:MAG: hypothetical protein RLY57_186 [Candidatus Parcubacteria bacterium]|jgi:uncharacterized protein YggU (UPF0235/DUF167 family)
MYIKVRALTNQRKELVEVLKENSFKISVKVKAERNLANSRIIELVAKHFKVAVSTVRIINGHHSPSKLLVIPDND